MTERDPQLLLQSAPFLRRGVTTRGLMVEVMLGLTPVVLAAAEFFGVGALMIVAATTLGAVLTEYLVGSARLRGATLLDGSAILTGILLGLCLPPGIPLWMAFLGGVVAIGLGKTIFGGLGQNLFNPALVGRAFLQAAFPITLTTWSTQGTGGGIGAEFGAVPGSLFAAPFMTPAVDAVSTATPLGLMKFENVATPVGQLFLGNIAGSLGETCGLVIILSGLVLALRRIFDWRIPVAILLTVAVSSGLVWMFDRAAYPSPLFMLGSGGLLFGAVYIATDPVTSPITPRGAWIFGIGVGVLVVLIRVWGGLPEGVMYAILLMNATTPLIDRITQPRGFGRGRDVSRVDLTISAFEPKEPSSLRLVVTLALAGMLSGLALAGVYQITKPTIDANKALALQRAVLEVVPGAVRMEKHVRDDGRLVSAGDEPRAVGEVVFAAYDETDRLLGYAIEGQGAGFQDTIRLLFGYDPMERRVIGMEILDSRETPGLGDKIYKDDEFVGNFAKLAIDPGIVLVKKDRAAENEVDAITGATISSRAVVRIIDDAIRDWLPALPAAGPETGDAVGEGG